MSARRSVVRMVLRGRSAAEEEGVASTPPVFWGRVGAYEGVSREGVLLLLAPDPVHPTLRVRPDA